MDYPFKALECYESFVYQCGEEFLKTFGKGEYCDLVRVCFNSDGVEFAYTLSNGMTVADGITVENFLEWFNNC